MSENLDKYKMMDYSQTNIFGLGWWYLIMDDYYIAVDVNGDVTVYGLGGPYAQRGGQPWRDDE